MRRDRTDIATSRGADDAPHGVMLHSFRDCRKLGRDRRAQQFPGRGIDDAAGFVFELKTLAGNRANDRHVLAIEQCRAPWSSVFGGDVSKFVRDNVAQ